MSAQEHSGFIDAMRSRGIVPSEPISNALQPGKFASFAIEGDRPGERSGWAILSENGVGRVSFGSRRLGAKGSWQDAGARRQYSASDRAAIAARKAVTREREAEVAKRARDLWDRSPKAHDNHPALCRLGHGLASFGVRQDGNSLLVPMLDEEFRLWNLTTIYPTGIARPMKGGRRDGLFWAHAIVDRKGRPSGTPLVIADRYEAASAIHAPTGLAVAASMSTENLGEIARIMRRLFPRREIIVAAYDDRGSGVPYRLRSAVAAAHAIGAKVAIPLPLSWGNPEGLGFECLQFGDIIERVEAAERIGGAR